MIHFTRAAGTIAAARFPSEVSTMSNPLTIRNVCGRTFRVGQVAIAFDQPIPGRAFPCRVASIAQTTEGRALPALVGVELFLPRPCDPVAVHVDRGALFPTFDAITNRADIPRWFVASLYSIPLALIGTANDPLFWSCVGSQSGFDNTADAIEVGEAFAVRRHLHDEHYETLDRWLGSIDRLIDANTLQQRERADLDALRLDVQRERVAALRQRETNRTKGAAS